MGQKGDGLTVADLRLHNRVSERGGSTLALIVPQSVSLNVADRSGGLCYAT